MGKYKGIIKLLGGAFLILFFIIYIGQATGFYQIAENRKVALTEEAILRFEADVKEGKDVSLEDYLSNTNIDYSNTLTKTTSNISIKLNKYLKTILVNGFDIFDGLFK